MGDTTVAIVWIIVVANILKLVPAAGSIAGGAISAGTAGVITAALGGAYIAFMELVYKGEMNIEDLSSKNGKETLSKIFKEKLKLGKKNFYSLVNKENEE